MTTARQLTLTGMACLAPILGTGQSAEDAAALPTQKIRGSAACLRIDRVHDFRVIDSQTVIVWRPNHRDPHKIELYQGCPRLRSANVIYFDARGWDQICGGGGEYLVVTRPGFAVRPLPDRRRYPEPEDDLIEERCAVKSVEQVSDDVIHELLVKAGDAAPRGPQRPDSVEVVDAEENKN